MGLAPTFTVREVPALFITITLPSRSSKTAISEVVPSGLPTSPLIMCGTSLATNRK